MESNSLLAISPIDGRYAGQTAPLAQYFSEFGLIKFRIQVEIEYFIALCELPLPGLEGVNKDRIDSLRAIYQQFDKADARKIKEIEKTTNHDVKAVEYFIKEKMTDEGLEQHLEFIHFGLTSQDINNTAIPLSLQAAMKDVLLPKFDEILSKLRTQAKEWQEIPMLAKTHGQPASPTRLGKEFQVFITRLENQLNSLKTIPFAAKFGGATGNMNAHYLAYPKQDWHAFADDFVNRTLGLYRSFPTTQIEHYDHLAAMFDGLKRLDTILVDLARDIWQYISMGYFKQKLKEGEVGSSAMPHKVNPIDFENAEGNLGVANALFEHFAAKLPISRLQRDLTDSTVLRNIGVPIGHLLISLNSLLKGLGKLELNVAMINHDLEENWAVVAEGIQNILRREGYPKPYEALKDLTRTNKKITAETISLFIDGLAVNDAIKAELKAISPFNYTGR
jgi:adenylosuccinate lyase